MARNHSRTVYKMARVSEPDRQHRIVGRSSREARAVMQKYYPEDHWFDESRQGREEASNYDEREVLS